MDEFGEITEFIQQAAGGTAELITGYGTDASLGDGVSVTIIATGFKSRPSQTFEASYYKERKVVDLNETKVEETTTPVVESKEEPFVYVKEEVKEEKEITFEITETNIMEEPKIEATITETTIETKEFTFTNVTENTDTPVSETKNESVESEHKVAEISREEQIKLAQERIRKLKEITLKMKSPEGLAALEKETAFERKNISLENKTPSTESNVSRYTLSEGDDKKIEIRPNNSFLHDNVD